MNRIHVFNLRCSNSTIQKWTIFLSLGVLLSFTACEKNDVCDCNDTVQYPSLKVVNQLTDSWRSITKVSLVGYDFDNLDISPNSDSQTFTLNNGMPGGYENIYVKVFYMLYPGNIEFAALKIDFKKAETTTITLKGCYGAEGCPGIYLE